MNILTAVELKLTARHLRKQPIVTAATLVALAVGIGMATTGFTLLDAVLFSRLPYANGDRFVVLEVFSDPEGQRAAIEADRRRHLVEHATTLEHVGAFRGTEVALKLPSGELSPVTGSMITPGSIAAFPYAPVLGRALRAEDGLPGAEPVVLLRESLWRRHFSADARVIGTAATISGIRRTIVGVMPDAFRFPGSGEIWLPLSDSSPARTFGVLRPGHEPAAASAELAALTRQYEIDTPHSPRLRILATPFTEALSRGLDLLTTVLVGALVLVLLVIAANIANLVLARTISRSRELAVRTALGASRARLIGQVFTEVLVVGTLAAAIGLGASQAVLAWVRQTLTDIPFWVDFTASPRTMAFVVCITLVAAAVAGVVPALKATRRNVADALAANTRTAAAGFGKGSVAMIAIQVAVSIALLNGALVMARGVAGYANPALPVASTEVLTAKVWAERAISADGVLEAARAIPGAIAAGAASSLPGLSPAADMTTVQTIPGGAASIARPAPSVAVSSGFFETLGATAQAGRLFEPTDFGASAAPVAVVNEPFVRKFFGGANPVGARLRPVRANARDGEDPWREIVGVVPDLGLSAGDPNMAAGYYVPMPPEELFLVALRTAGDARRLAAPLREAVAKVDATLQVREVVWLQDVGREDRAIFAGISAALAALGGMALLLSVMGTYAILSLSVTRRTREIGIRTALGASRGRIMRTVLGRVCVAPTLGAAAGMLLGQALVAARGIFAFRLPESSGPWGLPALAAVMVGAGLLAAWVPARRALRIAPADALRSE